MTAEEIKALLVQLAGKWKREAETEQWGAIAGTLRECADELTKLVKEIKP